MTDNPTPLPKYRCRWCKENNNFYNSTQLKVHMKLLHNILLDSMDLSLFTIDELNPVTFDQQKVESIIRQHVSASARAIIRHMNEKFNHLSDELSNLIANGQQQMQAAVADGLETIEKRRL